MSQFTASEMYTARLVIKQMTGETPSDEEIAEMLEAKRKFRRK